MCCVRLPLHRGAKWRCDLTTCLVLTDQVTELQIGSLCGNSFLGDFTICGGKILDLLFDELTGAAVLTAVRSAAALVHSFATSSPR